MVRPSFFLICSVKVAGWRRRLMIPVALWVLDDLLQSVCALWSLGVRFKPDIFGAIWDRLPESDSLLSEVSRIFSILRKAGPFTLVDVDIPDQEVKVSVRLV